VTALIASDRITVRGLTRHAGIICPEPVNEHVALLSRQLTAEPVALLDTGRLLVLDRPLVSVIEMKHRLMRPPADK
jgi:hypothetical protein